MEPNLPNLEPTLTNLEPTFGSKFNLEPKFGSKFNLEPKLPNLEPTLTNLEPKIKTARAMHVASPHHEQRTSEKLKITVGKKNTDARVADNGSFHHHHFWHRPARH